MSKLLFKLRNVPDDEAEAVRKLLNEHHIDYFETDAGNWGVSMPGIWLKEPENFSRAKDLLEEYQLQRAEQARAQYHQEQIAGTQKKILDSFREKPLITLGLVLFCLFVLYFSLKPFVTLIKATHS